ncbi:hypothetical protein BJ875DRAFT_390848 [Amylocarpus encephaloides]|uniref:J domain-containing protein n=1 Tax=Amylocarpus encephaloides TaxID=45428 RepID=A0A9P7YTB6_9HELO|nr:hypothetical protein BJ875DRAFT_390848 [Amylocarpus encephaloides]
MPPRSWPFPVARQFRRAFHSSAILRDLPNHYETLGIQPSATPAEVKKAFYALSKAHHPDLNPDDPSASKRFVRISEAYTTLGTPAKKRDYDRDFLPRSQSQSQSQTPRCSYSSSGPAGGRPASGLSRRRTHFQGPPPSFYRSGGWGEQSAKRQAAQESSTAYTGTGSSNGSTSNAGGMRPGQSPTGQAHGQELPHFDWREHLRTHENQSRRLRLRRRANGDPVANGGGLDQFTGGSTFRNLLLITSIISFGLWLPYTLVEKMIWGGERKKRAQ